MGKLKVSIKATLENVTDLRPVGDDFNWMFKLQCGSCREEHPNWVGIDATETREISGSRGEANFVWRCTLCKREHSINFDSSLDRSKAVYTAEQSEEQKFAAIAVLECRGCEITAFDPKGIWSCKGTESGTKFEEVELSLEEPDGWTDYDEKSNEPVSVMEFESKIERA
ncbi:hypothetical protein BCR35DRAFT_296853 [Leucosporidium creatinivorum]|uniref:DUF866-domain-containing protein n=1 Tax=Leucosporidium creatinivorum TaxID=106004 RepID=A0A1Y2D3X9_9BASI|nr:hypothetical protein BCR35DRAFT_296853 [Leucosporidium creatinivorum]